MTKLAFVSRVVNDLKARYGVRMDYYYPTTNAFDAKSGAIGRTYTLIAIRKSLILPTNAIRDFEYDIAFLAANKNFTFGGFFDKDKIVVCVNYKDMRSHAPVLEDHVVYLNKKWMVKIVKEYADLQCYVMELQAIHGEPFVQIYNKYGESTLVFEGVSIP